MSKGLFVLMIGMLLIASTAMATTYAVPDSYETIQSAINASSTGDTVLVDPGTYTENIDFLGKGILVCSDSGAAVTTITASTTSEPVVRMDSSEPRGAELYGFTITGSSYGGIYCYGSSPTITNNIIEDNNSNYINNGGGIDLNYTSGSFISGNVFRYDSAFTYGAAIHTEYAENDTICYNLIYNCYGYYEIRCLNTKAAIYNNTIDVDGSRFGGIANQLSDTLNCRNNIIVNVPDAYAGVYAKGIYAANGGYAIVAYNDFYNNANGPTGGAGIIIGTGNITSNPMFVGTPAGEPGEYDLNSGSYCIDAGDTSSFFDDFDGTRNDMGWRPWGYDLPVLYVPTQYSTIQAAIDAAVDEDTIVVFSGTYTENIDFLGKEILVRSDSGAAVTTITASTTSEPVVRMDSSEPRGAELYGFTITGSSYGGIYCYGSSPTITNNIIEDNNSNYINNGGGIDLNYTSGSFISGNVFRYDSAFTYGAAIHTEYAENDTICYNLIYNCYGYYEIRCLNTKAAIYNNTIDVDGSRFGGIANQLSDTLNCRNNIIVNVPDAYAGVYASGIYAANGGYAIVAYNDFYNNANDNTDGAGIIYGTGNLADDDPLFVGTPADDPDYYDIYFNSPCVDAGDTAVFFNDSDNSRNDMGWKPNYLGSGKRAESDNDIELPSVYSILTNYPNPFNAATTIEYSVPRASVVTVQVYDLLGRRVAKLVDSYQNAGIHQVTWKADDIASGTYFYRISADDYSRSEKMLLLK